MPEPEPTQQESIAGFNKDGVLCIVGEPENPEIAEPMVVPHWYLGASFFDVSEAEKSQESQGQLEASTNDADSERMIELHRAKEEDEGAANTSYGIAEEEDAVSAAYEGSGVGYNTAEQDDTPLNTESIGYITARPADEGYKK